MHVIIVLINMGKTPCTPYSGFTPGTPGFTHYNTARQIFPHGKVLYKLFHSVKDQIISR